MRIAGLLTLGLIACSGGGPVGSIRMPVQVAEDKVELRTFLVRTEYDELILFDVANERDFSRGGRTSAWMENPDAEPFQLSEPKPFPMRLFVRQGVIEDGATRAYSNIPIPLMETAGETATRVTLVSEGQRRTLTVVAGNIFADEAEAQPAHTDLPGPLFAMGSIAGVGVFLPKDAATQGTWRDAMSTLVPPDPTKALACAAPILSNARTKTGQEMEVAAGKFNTINVQETFDSCRPEKAAELMIFEVARWYAAGVGPVRMNYKASDGRRRDYRLVSYQVQPGSEELWPLAEGNRWAYEVRGPDGLIAGSPIDVVVESVKTVRAPRPKE